MKKYFVANEEHADAIYGNQYPVCMDEEQVRRLSAEWDVDLFEQMHEATEDEIAEYGCYDTESEMK